MLLWVQFLACTAVIVTAGTYVSKYGDIIAEKTGLGRTWIGVVLIASVTSLPELVTGASSVLVFDVPDIAAGNVLGACMLNLLMIPILDLLGGPTPLSTKVHEGHVLTAAFASLMLGVVIMSLITADRLPQVGWMSITSFIIIGIYLVAMRTIFLYERRRIAAFVKEVAEASQYREISSRKAYGIFAGNALLIVGAAVYLPGLGEEIATASGLGETFVGSVLIAISTTLPELVVSVSAVVIGAPDMAVGNLFGSSVFNLFILALDDVLYTAGPLLEKVSTGHLVSSVAATMGFSIAIIGLVYRAHTKPVLFAWESLAILVIYIASVTLLYELR